METRPSIKSKTKGGPSTDPYKAPFLHYIPPRTECHLEKMALCHWCTCSWVSGGSELIRRRRRFTAFRKYIYQGSVRCWWRNNSPSRSPANLDRAPSTVFEVGRCFLVSFAINLHAILVMPTGLRLRAKQFKPTTISATFDALFKCFRISLCFIPSRTSFYTELPIVPNNGLMIAECMLSAPADLFGPVSCRPT